MRCAVATLPTFRLQSLGYHDHCTAILLSGRGGIVLAMTAAARRISATASEPKGARVVYLNPRAETDALEALMLAVSPERRTFALPPDAFGAEMGRGEDDQALAQRLSSRLSARGYQARVVVADDPGIALAVSAWAKESIVVLEPGAGFSGMPHLPIEALGMSPELVARLTPWGVRTVGAFAALPAKALERYGAEAVAAHGLARGRQGKRDERGLLDWRSVGVPALDEPAPLPENVVRLKPAHNAGPHAARGIRLEFRARAG